MKLLEGVLVCRVRCEVMRLLSMQCFRSRVEGEDLKDCEEVVEDLQAE